MPYILAFSPSLPSRANFAHVDIHYQELSYEVVEEQPAFKTLSLMSEFGGLLGLMLGASVITVCELLEFTVQLCVYRCRGRAASEAGTT